MHGGQPEAPPGPSSPASVVLDIGPHAGALVLYTDGDLAGEEIEIRPSGGTWDGTHTAVRERHVGHGVVHAGVFGSLPEGLYDLRPRSEGSSARTVSARVRAGAVAEARLPAADPVGPRGPRTPTGGAQ